MTKFPGYRVSSFGRVKGATGLLMKGYRNKKTGYWVITITSNRSDTGRQKKAYIHQLVCETFHGDRPEGLDAAHNDGDKSNNRPDNLRWATKKSNTEDALKHGTLYIPGAGKFARDWNPVSSIRSAKR